MHARVKVKGKVYSRRGSVVSSQRQRAKVPERHSEGQKDRDRDNERDRGKGRGPKRRGNSVYVSLLVSMNYSFKASFAFSPLGVRACSVRGRTVPAFDPQLPHGFSPRK